MLIELSQVLGDYLHEVFIQKFQWWVLLGYVAQIMFTMRFVVQWVSSERAKRSVMPVAFWWFSLGGGLLLAVYGFLKHELVIIAGQVPALIIYTRNLHLIRQERRKVEV